MAEIAAIRCPRDFTIVAGTTEFSLGNLIHGHIVAANPHLESQFRVTDTALETYSMKPVGKYHRIDALLV